MHALPYASCITSQKEPPYASVDWLKDNFILLFDLVSKDSKGIELKRISLVVTKHR